LKEIKIHEIMSKEIGTRVATQCRSHHQKMLMKYRSIKGVISNFKRLVERKKEMESKEKLINYGELEKEVQ